MFSENNTGPETIKLRNHHLTLVVWPEGGRVLEVQSLERSSQLLSWWPHRLRSPGEVGGIGDSSEVEGAGPYKWTRTDRSVTMTRHLPGDILLEKTLTLPPDSLWFSLTLQLRNNSPKGRSLLLSQSAAVCPGHGGACPQPASGISHCREKAVLKRPDEEPETVHYEVFESVHVERDDIEWAAFVDPVSDNLFAVMPPEGHVTLTTSYHWWLEWTKRIHLDAGAGYTGEFVFAATPAIDAPVLASRHIIAGFCGKSAPLEGRAAGRMVFVGLDDDARGNEISLAVNGREIAGGKPMPAGREPLEIALPEWPVEEGVCLDVSVAGKFGQARFPACRCGDVYRELVAVAALAARKAEKGDISRTKAASVLALKKIVDLAGGGDGEVLEKSVVEAFGRAVAVLDSPLDAVEFYNESEIAVIERLSEKLDLDEILATLLERLSQRFDLAFPRFREPPEPPGASALADTLFDAALLLLVRPEEALLAAFREKVADITALWRKYGAIRYETIHHGVLLCRLIPALKLASERGWLSLDLEADLQALVIDLCAKVERQGGRQFRLSNWWAMEHAPLAYLGALFPYLPEATRYRNAAHETFYWLLLHGTLPDGGFWEMSPSYHVVTLTYLHHIAEALLRAGEDLYNRDVRGRRLASMAEFLKAVAAPAGALPAFDDGGRTLAGQPILSLAKRLHDGELLFHAEKAFERAGKGPGVASLFIPAFPPGRIEPRRGSEVLTGSGKLILRSADGVLCFIFDFGPHGGWHGHSDKLSFEAFWRDACVIPDAGCYKYEEPLHWEWFKTAAAHNTVTLGERNRDETFGRLLFFEERPGFVTAAMTARVNGRTKQRREVTLSARTLLVDDFLDGAPKGETMVWRLNSFVPIAIEGQTATFEANGLKTTITPVTEGATLEVAEVPIVADRPPDTHAFVTGFQLRICKGVCEDSQRLLVRIDFDW